MSAMIQFADFLKIDLRIGTVIGIQDDPKVLNSFYQLEIDLGPLGRKYSLAQMIRDKYKQDLIGRQVITVVNFPFQQVGRFKSEILTLGLSDDHPMVIALDPTMKIPNGSRLF